MRSFVQWDFGPYRTLPSRRFSSNLVAIHPFHVGHIALHAVQLLHARPAGRAHAPATVRIREQQGDRIGQGVCILRRNEQTGLPRDYDVQRPPWRVAITGLPAAIASIKLMPKGSGVTDGRTKMSIAASKSGTSCRKPVQCTRSSRPNS